MSHMASKAVGTPNASAFLEPVLRLKRPSLASISRTVSIFRLFAIFVALSVLFAPFAMRGGQAMAATPSSHHAQMADQGHCQPAPDDQHGKLMSKPCCAAMCAAVAIAPMVSVGEPLFLRMPATQAAASFHREILSEIATPPPRLA